LASELLARRNNLWHKNIFKINKESMILQKILFLVFISTGIESMYAAEAHGLRNHIKRQPRTQKASAQQVPRTLCAAIRDNDSSTFKQILPNLDLASLSAKSPLGDTPLHLAIKYERKKFIKALLKAGAPLDIKNNDGKTPAELDISKQFGDLFLKAEQEHLNTEATTKLLPHTAEQSEEFTPLTETSSTLAQERHEDTLAEAHESLERIKDRLENIAELQASIAELQAGMSANHERIMALEYEAETAPLRAELEQAEARRATLHEEYLRSQAALAQHEAVMEASKRQRQASKRQRQAEREAWDVRVNEARERANQAQEDLATSIRSLKNLLGNILMLSGGGTIVMGLGNEWRKACKKVNAHILEQQKIALAKNKEFNEPTKIEYTKTVLRLMYTNINAAQSKAKKTALGLALASLASGIGIRAWAY
jgi:hypothetical protein